MSKSRRIRLFESSIEKTGRILAQKWNIKVIFKANECKTSGQVIYLPVVPNNASDDLLNAMQGHLDHEAAHVIFTDFDALRSVKRNEKKLFSMVNALEDPRIERKMAELWRGTALNFRRKFEWSLGKIVDEREMEDENGQKIMSRPWDQLSDFGKFTYVACVWAEAKFDDSHWFITDIVEPEVMKSVRECESLIRAAVDANSTDDVIEVAREIMQKINEEDEDFDFADPAEVPDDAIILPPQPMGADNSHMHKQGPQSTNQNGPQVYQSEWTEEDICPECGGTGEDDNGDPCKACGSSGAQSQNGGSQQPEDNGPGQRRPMEFSPGSVTDEQLSRDAQITSNENFLLEEAKQSISDDDSYLVYTTEGDVIENIRAGDRTKYRDFLTSSTSAVSTMKRRLSRSLLSTNVSRWEGDKTRGKLNPRAVFRVPLGTSKRVFRKKVESESFNTVVEIMIDHSSSMNGSRLELAAQTTVIMGEVLHQLGIPFSVTGFSTVDYDTAESRAGRAGAQARSTYARFGDLWIGMYKDYNESWPSVASRIICMRDNARCNTYDGESLRFGAQRLLSRPEKRKILFWLNDGQPCPNYGDNREAHRRYALECAKEVDSKVELMAFGIMTESVKNYYRNYVVVNDIDELPAVCLSELDALLRKTKNLKAA